MGESEAAAVASEAILTNAAHSGGENVAVAPSKAASKQSPKGADANVKMVDPIDKYSALIVRGTIVGMGIVGVALFMKNSRLFAKFEHVSQIPKEFVRKELELKGKIREVLPDGILRVEHEPIVKVPFLTKKPTKNIGLLKMRLAGVELSPAGQQFITKDLRIDNKPVIFTVIKSSEQSPDTIDAEVTLKRNAFQRTNLNLEVVRRGYARVPPVEDSKHLKALQSVPAYARLISRLLLSEKVADRRGIGVWERDTWVESVKSVPSQVGGMVKANSVVKFTVLLFNVTKDVILYGVKFAQQMFVVACIIAGYIASGYRKFGVAVDRISTKYNQIRAKVK